MAWPVVEDAGPLPAKGEGSEFYRFRTRIRFRRADLEACAELHLNASASRRSTDRG